MVREYFTITEKAHIKAFLSLLKATTGTDSKVIILLYLNHPTYLPPIILLNILVQFMFETFFLVVQHFLDIMC